MAQVAPGSPMTLFDRVGTLRTAALIAATMVAWLQGGAFALASSGCEAVQGGRLSLKDGVVEFAAVDGFAVGDKVHYQIKAGPRDGSGGLVVVLPGGATSNIASVNGFGAVHGTYTVQNTADSIVATASGSASMTVQCTPAPLKLKSPPSSIMQVGQPYSQANVASGGSTPYTYSVSAGALPAGTKLDPSTGVVSGTPGAAGAFSYTIKITDSSKPPQTVTRVVSGMIAPAPLTMASSASSTTQAGQSYSQTNVASGGTTSYTYSVSAGALPDGTKLDASSGTVSGTPTAGAVGAFSYTIKVTDSGCPTQTVTNVVSGTIVPQPPPKLIMTSTASSNTQMGQSYSQTNEVKGGTPPYTFSYDGTLPAGTKLDTSNGTVSGTLTAVGAFNYTIKVTDTGNPAQTATYAASGKIDPATLTITPAPFSITQVGQPYSQANEAKGGTPPYTFSIIAGALPNGTTLDPTGKVSGMPTTAGPFSYTIKVTDSGSPPQTAQIAPVTGTITVRMPVTLISKDSAMNQVGQPYSQTNVGDGGTPPYKYSAEPSSLPAGTKLDASNGTVSGTPTTAGNFSYAITVTDSGSPTLAATNLVNGTIAPPPTLMLISTDSAITRVGQSYLQTNVGSGGIAPHTYSVASGALPAGTTLDVKNGTVSGTPTSTGTVSGTPSTAGSFSYTIKMTDGATPMQAISNVVRGVIYPLPLTMTSAVSAVTQVGQLYSQTNVGSGGTAPYTYWVSAGAPPVGTKLDTSTGTVLGTPTKAGTFNYTITITETCGCGWSQTTSSVVSGTIALPTLIVTPTPSSAKRVGQPYSQINVASGGTPPYTFVVSGGALPDGTKLDVSNGTVSGTPTTAASFSYTIKVTDNGRPAQTATTNAVSGKIDSGVLGMTSTPSATKQVGQSYSQPNVASGGTPPYTYEFVGALPSGTTLNSSTGTVLGTASRAGTFSYTIKLTDSSSPAVTLSNVISGTIAPEPLPKPKPGPVPPHHRLHRLCPCGSAAGWHHVQHFDWYGAGHGEHGRRVQLHYQDDGQRLAALR